MRIPITVQDHDLSGHFSRMTGAARLRWPIRFGVPLPQGAHRDPAKLALVDGKRRLPCDGQITCLWPDGSIRWLSMLALVDLDVGQVKRLSLQGSRRPAAVGAVPVDASEDAHGFSLANGCVAVEVSRALDTFRITFGRRVLAGAPPRFELQLSDGKIRRPRWDSARLERDGPLRARVVFTGHFGGSKTQDSCAIEFGMELTAEQPWLECFHRLTHDVPGKPSLRVRRLAVMQAWKLKSPQYVVRQSHRGTEWLPRDVRKLGRAEVRVTAQRAAVPAPAMVGESIDTYPPYLRKGLTSVEPWLATSDATHTILFWTPEALGNSPQGWTLTGGKMTFDLIPRWGEPAEFPQGRAKTHRWRWHFSETPAPAPHERTPDPHLCFESAYQHLYLQHALPPLVAADPAWIRCCGAADLQHALDYEPNRHPRFEGILNGLFDINWPAGMFNLGDDVDQNYTQNYGASGVKAVGAVWTNNEYDFIYAVLHQMLRTGQGRLWRTVERTALHAMDVDFVHYSDDPWLHHGTPAHSVNHTTAAAYPSHIWTEGLLHYYYLSADPRALETAKRLGGFILRYQEARWWVFEETARESGWALLALTELYTATGDHAYLDGALRIKDFVVRAAAGSQPLFPGEASFFIGVLVLGLDRLHACVPDSAIPGTIDGLMMWRLDHRMSPEGIPLYHWNAGERMVNSREIIFPAALAVAWRHHPRVRYLNALWRCLQFWFDTHTFYGAPRCTKNAASFYRTWIEAFEVLAAQGWLKRLEFQLPGERRVARRNDLTHERN